MGLIFHVSVPYDIQKTDEEIKSSLALGIKTLDESYEAQIEVDRVYFEDQTKTKDESADQKDE